VKQVHGLGVGLSLIMGAIAVSACGGSEESDAPPRDEMNQLANPASVYCVDQGGTLEIVQEDGGDVGYCNLPDGTRIDEWEYYRTNNKIEE
jgi:putative hemolysin